MSQAVTWGTGRREHFLGYIYEEMSRALGNRGDLEQLWANRLDQYRALVTNEIKRFPYENSANYTLPVTAMDADPLIARFVTTLHTPSNLWTVQALNEKWVDIAKPMQDYLEYLDQTRLKMYDVNYRAMLDFVKLGTTIYKHGWTFERRMKQTYDPQTGKLQRREDILSAPFVDHVPLQNFLIPPEASQIQPDDPGGASWVAEKFYLRQPQFLARAEGQEPFLPNYDPAEVAIVQNFVNSQQTADPVLDKKFLLDDYQPSYLRRIELWEVHARYDTTGLGTVDDIVVVFHLPSRRMLRAIVNPYAHNARPYSVARYFRGDGFYGIGLCEQTEMFQTLMSDLLNSQVDNVRLANSPMIAVKQGANVVPGEPIYLLKMWLLDNPSTDIREFKFTDAYNSLPQLESIVGNWRVQRDGFDDLQRGSPADLPSRTPATSMLSLLQQGNRRFDLSLKDLRACLDDVGRRLLQNMQQFLSNPVENPEAPTQLRMIVSVLGQPGGSYVTQTLSLPLEDIQHGLAASITATSGTVNKEVEKQGFLSLVQLQAQLSQQYMQLAQIISNPQVQQVAPLVAKTAEQIFVGFSELQRRLLEQFDIRNPEDILVDAAVLLDAQAQNGGGQPALGGPVPAGAGLGAGGGLVPTALLAGLGVPSGGMGQPV